MLASTYGEQNIKKGDEIVISYMEHHSNLIPWQQLALRKQAKLKFINITSAGELDLKDAKTKITDKTKIVSICHAGNVLGVINPIKKLAKIAHYYGAILIADGAQAAPHIPVNVQDLGVDFYALSGHKMLGPTGIGVLYGKANLLEKMNPYQFGGEMINSVHLYKSSWDKIPWKFEAGTQNIAGVIGLGAAIDYLSSHDMKKIQRHEKHLIRYFLPKLLKLNFVKVYGPHDPEKHSGVVAFNIKGLHPHDLATALDLEGVAIRAGHHCAQPLMRCLHTVATARVSFYLYNTKQDADLLLKTLKETKEFFKHEPIKPN